MRQNGGEALTTESSAEGSGSGSGCARLTSMCPPGRDDVAVEYDVGFDGEGRVRGLRLRVRLLAGWAQDLATDDGVMLKDAGGMVRMS